MMLIFLRKGILRRIILSPLVNPRRSETGIENEIAIENQMTMAHHLGFNMPTWWCRFIPSNTSSKIARCMGRARRTYEIYQQSYV